MAEFLNLHNEFHLGNKFIYNVARSMSEILPNKYRVIVKYDLQELPNFNDSLLNIEIATSKETHQPPKNFFREDIYAIFQNYFMLDRFERPIHNPLVYPLPLGTFVDIDYSKIDIKPIPDRKYDFSFIGQIPHTGTRDCFKRNLDNTVKELGGNLTYFVEYTNGFNNGLSHTEYLDLLNESKIVLCPQGAYSLETFRFFEAIKMGAFPMVERLPALWYYEAAPFFRTKWVMLQKSLFEALNILNSYKGLFSNLVDYNMSILNELNLAQYFINCLSNRDSQNPEQLALALKNAREKVY